MARVDADRNLLFGLLALQNNFIDRNALLDAFNRWLDDRAVPLGRILRDRGALKPDEHDLLQALVAKRLEKFGGDPEKSLQHLSSIGSVREDLSRIADADLQASLAHVSVARPDEDPYRTVAQPSLGESTSTGSRFRVLRPHARGGLGQVSVALDQELDRPVALKEIQDRHADEPLSRARFVQEAEITGKLEHPGIIPVYGLGHDASGRPFYAMRFIQGDSLKEAIAAFHGDEGLKKDAVARMSRLRELLRRFTDVCNAVAYAHSRGVLHRDLKPGNIMLGPYGETLVVDWGLAKPVGDLSSSEAASGDGSSLMEGPIRLSGQSGSRAETVAGSPIGTPAYASPEQVTGALNRLGPASDVYGLGATLYALLTGRSPVESNDIGEVIRRVERGEILPPRSIDQAIPRPLEAICKKAMALEPEGRYASARGLAEDVTRWLDDEPVTAYAEPMPVRVRRWGRRHRIIVTSAILSLSTATILLAISLAVVQSERMRTSRALQEAEVNYEHARKAVDDYFVLVSEEKLLNEPGMQPLRKRLLELALDYHQRFRQEGTWDPRRFTDVAQSHYRFAMIAHEIGQSRESLEAYEKALASFEELARRGRVTLEYRLRIAECRERIGVMRNILGQTSDGLTSIEKAIREYRDLLSEQPSNEVIRTGLATSYYSIGNSYHLARKLDDAERSQQEAIRLLEALVAEHPLKLRYRYSLAFCCQNLSVILADQGRNPMLTLLRSRRLFEELLRDDPSSYRLRHELGKVAFRIGQMHVRARRAAGAREELERARALLEPLVRENPTVQVIRGDLASTYELLVGAMQNWTSRGPLSPQAFDYLERAHEHLGRLYREDPGNLRNAYDYGGCCNEVGTERLRRNDVQGAVESFDQARAILAAAVKVSPENPFLLGMLASSSMGGGRALARSGEHEKAIASYREGIKQFRILFPGGMHSHADDSVKDAYKNLIRSLQALGRPGEIAEAVAEYRAMIGREPSELYNVACYLALCVPLEAAGREARATESVEMLREAVAAGWGNASLTARDPDLVPLHDREDFRRLLAEMFDRGFPEDPFAR